MTRVPIPCGAVSKMRVMAYAMLDEIQRYGWRHTTSSAACSVCGPGHLSDRFLVSDPNQPIRTTKEGRICAYLGSLGPHHTPIPAAGSMSGDPFPLHAPSEYTTSTVVSMGGKSSILGVVSLGGTIFKGGTGPGAGVATTSGIS